jgi:Flp pilus assembly pilin Flp
MAHTPRSLGHDPSPLRALMRDARGVVSTEYAIILGTVGLIAAGALVAAGPRVLSAYQHSRDILAQPFP